MMWLVILVFMLSLVGRSFWMITSANRYWRCRLANQTAFTRGAHFIGLEPALDEPKHRHDKAFGCEFKWRIIIELQWIDCRM
jgi:hypothetical protein